MFDALLARGQIVVHSTDVEQLAAMTSLASSSGSSGTVIADTSEQVADIASFARAAVAGSRPAIRRVGVVDALVSIAGGRCIMRR